MQQTHRQKRRPPVSLASRSPEDRLWHKHRLDRLDLVVRRAERTPALVGRLAGRNEVQPSKSSQAARLSAQRAKTREVRLVSPARQLSRPRRSDIAAINLQVTSGSSIISACQVCKTM